MPNKYRAIPVEVRAVQWQPDPKYGSFDNDGKYCNKRVGVDINGVQYLITECGINIYKGFTKIKPGDWIVHRKEGCCFVIPNEEFHKNFEKVGS